MSEEEIIDDLEDFLMVNQIIERFIDETAGTRQFDVASMSKKDYLAIQGLLDLYNKQKEKNKAIEVARKDLPKDVELVVVTKEDFEINFGSEYISKDKIKAKIEELENIKLCGDKFYKHLTEMKIKVLQELLEE